VAANSLRTSLLNANNSYAGILTEYLILTQTRNYAHPVRR